MKRFVVSLLSGILILVACAPATAESTVPLSPTGTPTMAPMVKVECPPVNPDLTPQLDTFFNTEGLRVLLDEPVLDFLNHGGDPQKLITALHQKYYGFDENTVVQRDMTGDGAIELILTDGYVVYVFGCKDKKYQTLLSYTSDPAWMQEIQFNAEDMNRDGIPELITVVYGGHTYTSVIVSIFGWNGREILPLLQGKNYGVNQHFTFADTEVPGRIAIYDTDGNGTFELVVKSELPTPIPSLYSYLMPWRNETDIYTWNGTHYTLDRIEYSPPEFRFQAVQDADYEVEHGNLEKALSIYQAIINSDNLKAFSQEILENQVRQSSAIDGHEPTPTPVPPDTTEYPRLAAYAYYRIILLHIVQRRESDASTVYKTLQQKFGNDPYGHPYVEMATAFWDAYQSSHKMYNGCAVAIDYAAKHSEILIPLGSDYHGSQSHVYVPADVCPFR